MDFNNKVVLVTGSSRSLGAQIIKDFASKGANVIIDYNKSEEKAMKLKHDLEQLYGREVLAIKCDISNEEEVIAMTDEIIEKYENIDILVNNAGICDDSLFDEKQKNTFLKVLETNVLGTYLVTKHIGKHINKGGRIINISSDNGLGHGYPESCDYDASKAGVISLTHNMAKFYAPDINVNCICPGWIDTDMNKDLSDIQRNEINKGILLERFASKKEISNVVLFLASSSASYVNDSIITVNGGLASEK